MRRWMPIVALSLLAAGCGEPSDPAPAPAVNQPVSAPAATPATLSAEAARDRYLEIVAPYNTVLEELETAANSGQSWQGVRSLAAEVARANAEHARALRTTAWPENVRAPMKALLAETDTAQKYWQRAAHAKTADELGQAIRSAAKHSGSAQATKVRSALGLPPYRES